jgi:hypothetical protein
MLEGGHMDEHGVNVHAILQLVMLCVSLVGCGSVVIG